VEQFVKSSVQRKLTGPESHKSINHWSGKWRNINTCWELYRQFYAWLGRKDLFRMANDVLEYTDVFPLIYCKIRLVVAVALPTSQAPRR